MAEQLRVLDRKAFAISQRQAGLVYTDFEDWDGLSDAETVGLVSFMNNLLVDPALIEAHSYEV